MKGRVLTKEELPVKIWHKKGEMGNILNVKSMVCLSCRKTFYRNSRDNVINKQISCPFCGQLHINTSPSFDLRKFDEVKDNVEVKSEKPKRARKPVSKVNAKGSTTRKKSSTAKNK